MTDAADDVVRAGGLSHRYGRIEVLADVTLTLAPGASLGVIGPDGVGKSTLLALVAGARRLQRGSLAVFGGDMADAAHRRAACPRFAYMPQGLGRNLYPDLTVGENLHFFGRLFGQNTAERMHRIAALLAATGLSAFVDRPAGKLSGGMKQKLALCCALIHDPDLLILDEPTTGVDPLSRQQFWELIAAIQARRPSMSLLIATAYMEEADRFDHLVAMHAGRVLALGTPGDLRQSTGTETLEEAFVALLPAAVRGNRQGPLVIPPRPEFSGDPVIIAVGLTKRFGDFVAVDNVSFRIERGEIFGFLGSNGCGKTTTMKLLTGLLLPSEGRALLFGQPTAAGGVAMRGRVGYMSQSFSLYVELTVRQNLDLHARLFHLPATEIAPRITELTERFGLTAHMDALADDLPLGVRQRLSLAVAVIHRPEMLILDEPTSGVDPVARDAFWDLLIGLSRDDGVTIFLSTHFMNEAARCDRISLMHAGRVLASGTPAEVCAAGSAVDLQAAFIGYLRDAVGEVATTLDLTPPPSTPPSGSAFRRRMLAYSWRELLELRRDPIRMTVALLGITILMLMFGFGISTDVDQIRFAVLDRDDTPGSRAYTDAFVGSGYFARRPPLVSHADMEHRMRSGDISLALELPPNFGRDLRRGRPTAVAAHLDAAMPFRAESMRGYVAAAHQRHLSDLAGERASLAQAEIEVRFRYNQAFASIYAMVPSTLALLLALIPAILIALAVVREKELGSITNLYVTPVTRLEFVLGKQLPYIGLSMVNFFIMVLMAVFLFEVPLKGSFVGLTLGALLYVTATTGIGLVTSAFTRTQTAALFGTSLIVMMPATQFSGLLQPVSSLQGLAYWIGSVFPTTYFIKISVGAFTKALPLADLVPFMAPLVGAILVLTAASAALLRKQER